METRATHLEQCVAECAVKQQVRLAAGALLQPVLLRIRYNSYTRLLGGKQARRVDVDRLENGRGSGGRFVQLF